MDKQTKDFRLTTLDSNARLLSTNLIGQVTVNLCLFPHLYNRNTNNTQLVSLGGFNNLYTQSTKNGTKNC